MDAHTLVIARKKTVIIESIYGYLLHIMKSFLFVYIILYFIFIFWKSKPVKAGEFNEDALSKKQTSNLQALSCIGVILHHLTQYYSSYGSSYIGPITIFNSMGIMFTAVFFFCSGYGLIYSYKNKDDYLNGFLSHRLLTVLFPFFVSNTVYLIYRMVVLKIPTDSVSFFQYLFGFKLINGNGWYIVEIFWLYIFFYAIFKTVKNIDIGIILLSIVTAFIIVYSSMRGHDMGPAQSWFKGEWWYNSTVVFILGMIVARFKSGIAKFAKRFYFLLLPLVTILLIVSFIIEEKILNQYGYYSTNHIGGVNGQLVTLIAQMIVTLLFVIFLLLGSMKICLGNKALSFISAISVELFLIHGAVLQFLEEKYLNLFVVYFVAIAVSVALGFVVNRFDRLILNKIFDFTSSHKARHTNEKDLLREKAEKKEKKLRRILLTVLIVVVVSVCLYAVIGKYIIEPQINKQEIEKLKSAKVSDEVLFGRYDTNLKLPGAERIEWIVLKKNDSEIMLISKEGLNGGAYHGEHKEVSWPESKMYQFLNENLYNEMFNENEKGAIIKNPETGEFVSLLSVSDAEECFTDNKSREINITELAENNGTYVNRFSKVNNWDNKGYRSSWWWLKGEGEPSVYAPIVTVDGVISTQERFVNKPGGAIRPVIWVKF